MSFESRNESSSESSELGDSSSESTFESSNLNATRAPPRP